MRQLLQSLKDGSITVADVPAPICGQGQVLIKTKNTLVSAGTERMILEFGKGNLLKKAKLQPEKVKMTLEKAVTDGVSKTFEAVRSKLDQPLAIGYCNVGQVIESEVDGLLIGDRVVSNGKHAEFVAVPKNLVARIPESVSDNLASFTVLAAISLQGIRLVKPTLGECIVVTGLGLIGLITVQLLRAQGCRVLGIDPNPIRLKLASQFGAEILEPSETKDPLVKSNDFSRGRGVDAVIITASSKDSKLVGQAAKMCRKRGRIVLVGAVGLELNRADFYEKELTFQVSCSYGPGRYDPSYEEGGQDYPIGFVRWTEQRNLEAVLDLMALGALDLEKLISHKFSIEKGKEAIELLSSNEPSLGILLNFSQGRKTSLPNRKVQLKKPPEKSQGTIGFLGAGNYASRILIPAFKENGSVLHTIVSRGGVSANHFGKKFGFALISTEASAILKNSEIDTVVIATRHNSHASLVVEALRAKKHVFCEKPLCLNLKELQEIKNEKKDRPGQHLMVGFNRRFAPQVVKMKSLLVKMDQPKQLIITVNAGEIPSEHWTQDRKIGGGRLLGETCHFIDLARYLVGKPIVTLNVFALGGTSSVSKTNDKVSLNVRFSDGSLASIHYLSNGNNRFPKERIEVFCSGRILQLNNYLKLYGWGWPNFKKMNLWRQNKGQVGCVSAFLDSIRNGKICPISQEEIIEISQATIEADNQLA